ncbi:MAG: LysE family transporter [Negativicutes bacterium]|nr:LysE family transporter [Negativicutes bacterium]
MLLFFKAAILGFFITAPVGPVGVLCIQRTLARGMTTGFVSGLGTAAADALYCGVAAFGVTVVASFLQDNQFYLNITGGIALICLGYHIFRSQIVEAAQLATGEGMFRAFASAFFLTLANPLTILVFAAVFAGIGVGTDDADYRVAALIICGVFIGSSAAWLALSGMVSSVRTKFCSKRLQAVNQLSGMILVGVGVLCLIAVFK